MKTIESALRFLDVRGRSNFSGGRGASLRQLGDLRLTRWCRRARLPGERESQTEIPDRRETP